MKRYVVYLEENEIKAGCTTSKRYKTRMIEQGIKSNIIFDTDDIFMASMVERMAQIFHGCPLDMNFYHLLHNDDANALKSKTGIKTQSSLKNNKIKYEERRQKHIQANQRINSDFNLKKHKTDLIRTTHEIKVIRYSPPNKETKGFNSLKEAALDSGMKCTSGISMCLNGKANTAGGYEWKKG